MHTTRASLLLRVRDPKDATAWTEFDAIYRPLLVRFGQSNGLGEADVEDVAQHCMTAIHKRIASFDYDPEKGRFKGWLRTLVNNRIRDLHRRRQDEQARTGDFERRQQREPLPEEAFERLWMDEHLKHALRLVRAEVEQSSYQAFRQYAIDGRPADQVCRELNLNANQLYAIKFRLTGKLRDKLKELLDGSGA